MRTRRAFITLLGGATVTWPLAARAQQRERMRRIGVLTNFFADDPEWLVRIAAFRQGLSELGWSEGGNVHIDTRWGEATSWRSANQATAVDIPLVELLFFLFGYELGALDLRPAADTRANRKPQ
jgi:hypothetical protein